MPRAELMTTGLTGKEKKSLKEDCLCNIEPDKIPQGMGWEKGVYSPIHGLGTNYLGEWKLATMLGGDGQYHVAICPHSSEGSKTQRLLPVLKVVFEQEPTDGQVIWDELDKAIKEKCGVDRPCPRASKIAVLAGKAQ